MGLMFYFQSVKSCLLALCDFQYLPFAQDLKTPGELKMVLDSVVPRSVIDMDYYK